MTLISYFRVCFSCPAELDCAFSLTEYELLQAQEITNEAGSVILGESPLSMPESSLTLEQSPKSIRNMLRNGNGPTTGECFEMSTATPDSNSPEVFSSLNTAFPPRGSKTSELNQEIHNPVIRTPSCEQTQNKVTMTTGEITTGLAAVNDEAVLAENQETRKFQAPGGSFRSKGTVVDTIQMVTTSDGYLQPVDNNNDQAVPGKARLFSPNHPQAKPRVKKSRTSDRKKDISTQHKFAGTLNQSNTDKLQNNPLYEREAPIQHCPCVRPVDQSDRLISPAVGTRIGHQSYQNCMNNNNDRNTTTPHSVESPYMKVLQSTNWEVSRDHLTLFERIGGGSFGQVWRGAVFNVAGDKEWSVVAVKMLKGKE